MSHSKWHFVAGVADRHQAARIYIDGVLDSEQVIDTSQYDFTNGRNPNIGRNDVTGVEIFSGAIDELRLYKRALSEETVRRLYEAGRSVGATPAGRFPIRIRCSDLSTGQTVDIPDEHTFDWDCEQAGLKVQPVDKIEIRIIGRATGGSAPPASE